VSKKRKGRGTGVAIPAEIRFRADKAIREGRFQAALELARELFKREPTPAHQELIRSCQLGRARELRRQGKPRDAATVLQVALEAPGPHPAEWLSQVAEELAACGQAGAALGLLDQLAGTPAHARVLARTADAAVQQEAAGRRFLPETLHADFDRTLQAFAQVQAGQDDAARETLQGIGLRSPFLEWKVLLRGLMAYYQKDDVRAQENWQRLDPERLPARLAAPLRFQLDPAYRTAQQPQAQAQLQKQLDRLQGGGFQEDLRGLQWSLVHEESLHRSFRLAETLLPRLRERAPHLVPRLAACCYWSVVTKGNPEDVQRYARVFGTPPDDPQLARLSALAAEDAHDHEDSHRHWQRFEQSIAKNSTWPADQANRVRALVWYHMGQNAARIADFDSLPNLPPFLRDHPNRPRSLKPTAETCFQRSLDLAPDQLPTHEALFHHYQDRKQYAKAETAAQKLLDRFPDHAPTLEALADLLMRRADYTGALDLVQRALKANPLDRRLRGKVGGAHLFRARTWAEAGEFDKARADYQAALAFRDSQDTYPVVCKWAACEFKAGNHERAEELLQKALAESGTRLAVAFNMVIEIIRLKLPGALKKRFNDEFNAALAEPPSAEAVVAVLSTAAAHQLAGVKYHGQKTHDKKVLAYATKALAADFNEAQLERAIIHLLDLQAFKPARSYTALGRRRFPHNPVFPFLEAESYLRLGPERCPIHYVGPLLEQARRLADKLPRDPRQQELLEKIQQGEELIRSLNPFLSMFEGGFGGMFDPFGDGFDDDDDDDDTW
jgi:tetratricopeptide (TPR) repeat protein